LDGIPTPPGAIASGATVGKPSIGCTAICAPALVLLPPAGVVSIGSGPAAENMGTLAIAAGGGMLPYGMVPCKWELITGAAVAVAPAGGWAPAPGGGTAPAEKTAAGRGTIPGGGTPPAEGMAGGGVTPAEGTADNGGTIGASVGVPGARGNIE
jgi:hypothetical protein